MRNVVAAVLLLGGSMLPTSVRAQPPMPEDSSVPGACAWEWMSGAGVGIWAERCTLATGVWVPRFDAALPGFVLTIDGAPVDTILQLFEKPAEAPVEAILPALRAGGYIPDDDDCVFASAEIRAAPRTVAFFEIRPTGKRLEAFEATPSDEVPEPPCGAYGWGTHGARYFMTDTRFPERVVYVNIGQDGTMFDDRTITLE